MLAFHALRDPNLLVIGLKGAPAAVEWSALRARAAALEEQYGLPFPRYVERLRSMNRWTAAALRIVPDAGEG